MYFQLGNACAKPGKLMPCFLLARQPHPIPRRVASRFANAGEPENKLVRTLPHRQALIMHKDVSQAATNKHAAAGFMMPGHETDISYS